MKERFSHELPRWMKLLGIRRINRDSVDFNWGYFAPKAGFEFVLNRGTYFDQRWAINIAIGWGKFMIRSPLKTKLAKGCDPPRYGFAIHNGTFWIYKGGKYDESIGQCVGNDQWITWDLPFFTYIFDGHWIREKRQINDRDVIGDWRKVDTDAHLYRKDLAYVEAHPFTYILNNGTIQNRTATCTIEKRKWHRKWFPFLTLTKQVIDIEFDEEVGERSGSWKGGIVGMSHDLLPNERIQTCLDRLKRERTLQ